MNAVALPDISRRLRQLAAPTGGTRAAAIFILLNFAIYFMRPQEIGPLGFLGTIRLPLLIALPPMLIWLANCTRGWAFQTRVMMFFMIAEACRTVIGKLVWEDLVVNDFWAFQVLKDFFLQFTTLIFPFVLYFVYGKNLKSFLRTWLLVAFYLGLYVATHGGKGPGGFLEDENDVGLALVFFLPFPLAYLIEGSMSGMKKLRCLLVSFMLILGVVVTFSRGTFVGLVCVFAYFFIRSKRKILLLVGISVVLLAALPFVPEEYLGRIRSIKDVKSGTAEIRQHYWQLATRVWLDPRHILIGVGMNNVSFHVGRYESMEDLEKFPSAAGRAMHSMYFQLLPDLGIWGAVILALVTIPSVRSNRRSFRALEKALGELEGRKAPIAEQAEVGLYHATRMSLSDELKFVRPMLLATNVAYVGVFSAGAFISVLYYPMVWFLPGLSIVLERYTGSLLAVHEDLKRL